MLLRIPATATTMLMTRPGISRENPEHRTTCTRIAPVRDVPTLEADVREGLLWPPRSLPPKYFYDDYGSRLFDQICETREYYPTRTEDGLLTANSDVIIRRVRPDHILELGSGTSRKTRRLLDACERQAQVCKYHPFDVCEPALEQAARDLEAAYSWLKITPLAGDYRAGLDNLPAMDGTRLILFLGSTIGNFEPPAAADFIGEIRRCMRPGDYLLLGADRVKDPRVLHAAYNDGAGLTALFNLNVLRVLNRELDADINLDDFRHQAEFNPALNRIEMHLESLHRQSVRLGQLGKTIQLEAGERILTEISRKFHHHEVEDLLVSKDLDIIHHFEPDNGYFSLVLAQAD